MKMRKKVLGLLGTTFLAAAVIGVGGNVTEAQAAETSGFTVTSSIGTISSANVGDEITIPLTFSSDTECRSFKGNLKGNYDTTVLEFVDAENGDDMPSGIVSVAGGNFSFSSGKTFKSGTFNLKFKVLKCAPKAVDVKVKGLYFTTATTRSTTADLNSTVTVNHPADKKVENVTKTPTCTEKGEKTVSCSLCNAELGKEEIKANGHAEGNWEVTKQPTCTEKGTQIKKCTTCGETVKTEDVKANGHTEGNWEVTKQPTCTEKGTQIKKCTVCGETVKTEDVKATGHDYKEEVTKEATCKEEGSKKLTCNVCGDTKTETIAKTAHTWKTDKDTDKDGWKVVTAATTEKEGSKERVCSICGEKETAVIAKLTDKKDDQTTTTDKNNTTTTKPSTDKNNTTTNKNNTTTTNKNNTTTAGGNSTTAVKTGDTTNVLPMAAALAASVCVIAICAAAVLKRRKFNR